MSVCFSRALRIAIFMHRSDGSIDRPFVSVVHCCECEAKVLLLEWGPTSVEADRARVAPAGRSRVKDEHLDPILSFGFFFSLS